MCNLLRLWINGNFIKDSRTASPCPYLRCLDISRSCDDCGAKDSLISYFRNGPVVLDY